MTRIGRILSVACGALACAASPAAAIINGSPDGVAHPEVGALIAFTPFADGALIECSGTLISPTVFLTAAHCDQGSPSVQVTFAEQYNAGDAGLAGTFIADPAYDQKQGDPHDIAVVLLDDPVNAIAPAALPPAGSLSALGKNSRFTSVGYGANEVGQSGGAKTLTYFNARYMATDSFNTLTSTWLKISQNRSAGNGGTCYGDSGGPNFIGAGARETNVIAGTTVTGDTWCRSTNVDYRLDTPSARSFLGQYVALP